MNLKIALAALATGLLVASCGDDDSGGGGGTSGLPEKAQAFVKNCQNSMDQQMAKTASKLPSDAKDKLLNAAKGMCGCIASEVHGSDKISAADKEKVWAIKEFKASAKPDVSADSKAAFEALGKKCVGKMMAAFGEIMKSLKK